MLEHVLEQCGFKTSAKIIRQCVSQTVEVVNIKAKFWTNAQQTGN